MHATARGSVLHDQKVVIKKCCCPSSQSLCKTRLAPPLNNACSTSINYRANIIVSVLGVAAASPDYVPNKEQSSRGGKIKQYPVFDRMTHDAQLKLHDDDRTTVLRPQPYNQTPSGLGYYNMKALKHGIVLIINNRNFRSHPERRGTERDEYNLIQTFYYLGYRPVVGNDLTSSEICYIFDNLDTLLANCDASTETANDSFVCCILSHGTKDSIIGSDSEPISRDYINQQVGRSKTLNGKPKIFFLQADFRGGISVSSNVVQADSDSNRADIYVCSATVSGNNSYRDIYRGSWFILELCKILCEFGTCCNLFEIQMKLNTNVSQNPDYRYQAVDGKSYVQQPSSSYNTLRYNVHFFHE